jgi:predicted Zn finger-like uncharacterized protein
MVKIKCPFCGYERDVDENIIPSNNVIVKCPKCENTFKYSKEQFTFSESTVEDNAFFKNEEEFFYAGFWIRLLAYVIDSLVLVIVFIFPLILFLKNIDAESVLEKLESGDLSVIFNITLLFIFLIFIIFISIGYYVIGWSKWGKTLGMKILGIKVVDEKGGNVAFGRALLRWLMGYFLPGIIPYVSALLYIALAIMIGVDRKKQGWHDKISKTYVIYDK